MHSTHKSLVSQEVIMSGGPLFPSPLKPVVSRKPRLPCRQMLEGPLRSVPASNPNPILRRQHSGGDLPRAEMLMIPDILPHLSPVACKSQAIVGRGLRDR
jgi:hypothetical protein